MGMGNKLFAIPWKAFEFAKPEHTLLEIAEPGDLLMLNVDKEKLKAAPGFDQDAKWPDFADRTWETAFTTTTATPPTGSRRIDDSGAR